MAVTSIKAIRNKTPYPMAFRKLEDASDAGVIPPHHISHNEVWVPWCNDAQQFSAKVLIIDVNEHWRAYVWQRDKVVYYCRGQIGFSTGQPYSSPPKKMVKPIPIAAVPPHDFGNGVPIPGVSAIGGDRVLDVIAYPNHNYTVSNFFNLHMIPK